MSTLTILSLTAEDGPSETPASGVRETLLKLPDDAEFAVAAATFSLAGPDGVKTLEFFSRDNLGNTEVIVSTQVSLDATAPETAFHVDGASAVAGGVLYMSGEAEAVLTAVDPVRGGVSSGFSKTF